jgi:uncharacterized protein YndB with AHSA1/START domain
MITKITAEIGKQDIWIERNFEAPKNIVFRLLIEADLIVQWQVHPISFKIFEAKNGGSYESSHVGSDGNTYGFKGVFHEIIPNDKVIKTSEFVGLPFKVIPTLEIQSVEDLNENQTKLSIQIICNSEEVRDAMVQHGMQEQFDALFIKIDTLLKTIL